MKSFRRDKTFFFVSSTAVFKVYDEFTPALTNSAAFFYCHDPDFTF